MAIDLRVQSQCYRFVSILYDVYFSFSHQIITRKVEKIHTLIMLWSTCATHGHTVAPVQTRNQFVFYAHKTNCCNGTKRIIQHNFSVNQLNLIPCVCLSSRIDISKLQSHLKSYFSVVNLYVKILTFASNMVFICMWHSFAFEAIFF